MLHLGSALTAFALVVGILAVDPEPGDKPIFLASPFPSLGGHNEPLPAHLRMPLVVREAMRAAYKGSTYRLHPDFEAEQVAPGIRRQILATFVDVDFVPDDRRLYFSWCDRPDLAVIGWNGNIMAIEQSEGGWLVQVRIHPKIVHFNWVATTTGDFYTERYFFRADGQFTFMGSDTNAEALRESVFDF